MARRKRFLDDDDSDDSDNSADGVDFENDADAREERDLFRDPYNKRKRQRRNGKEDALYGVFAEDMDDDRPRQGNAKQRSDWTKAPAFVSGEKADLEKTMDIDMDRSETDDSEAETAEEQLDVASDTDNNVDSDAEDNADVDGSNPSGPMTPAVEEEAAMEERSGGLGSLSSYASASSFSRGGIGTAPSKGGIGSGSSKGGIGSGASRAGLGVDSSTESRPSSAFGQSSFAKASTSFAPAKPAAVLPPSERAHFGNIAGSFGARMLSKMGWSAGTGLGATGEGIVTPIESKLRPQKMGIAFKGFKEKTEQSKMEAKRRGEVVSDDEEQINQKRAKGKGQQSAAKRSDVWKRPKKAKVKIQHKTYEEIIAEAGEEPPPSGIGIIIDATGAIPREVSSLADVSVDPWVPSNDPTRIPEVRHNLRLISDVCKSDLDGLAREGKGLRERKNWINNEDARLRKKVAEEAELIGRLQKVHLVVDNIQARSKELSAAYEPTLEPFSPLFCQLIEEFSKEYDKYRLDEIVVGAITPLVRRMVNSWNPLHDPSFLVSTFRTWKRALKVHEEEQSSLQMDVFGTKTAVPRLPDTEDAMTPFESLLWNVIVPRIRSSINNDWSPESPQPAVKLIEIWATFWPPFLRDNVLDQLILPKVHKAIAEWNPRISLVPLKTIVFPWLPFVGLRLDDVLGDARRKIKNMLRTWTAEEPIPTDLGAWKEVFDIKEWDSMMLKFIVPKLSGSLRNDFRVNPRDQRMEPIQQVLGWAPLLRASILSQILETEFFPKWLDVLHIWLTQPKPNFEEVTQWYVFWKGAFPEDIQALFGVSRGFTSGLQLMNKAIELGPEAQIKLPRPDFKAQVENKTSTASASAVKAPIRPAASRIHEITFRSIVEEFAASHNLLFLPTGRAHENSRMPLFRVSPSVDGKGGLSVYILDDAVWAPDTSEGANSSDYRAITLEDMVLRANANRL